LTHDELAPPSREVVTATFAARECFNGQGRSCNWPPPTLQGPPSTALMLHAQQPLLRRAAVLLHKSPGVATSVRRLAHATATCGCRPCYISSSPLLHAPAVRSPLLHQAAALATSACRPCYMWPPSGPSPIRHCYISPPALLHQSATIATCGRSPCYLCRRRCCKRQACEIVFSGDDVTASSPAT
jgi:hypothetical protein